MGTQFELNPSRRHFMKLLAGVGAGFAFSSTLGTFTNKFQPVLTRLPQVALLLWLQTCIFLKVWLIYTQRLANLI